MSFKLSPKSVEILNNLASIEPMMILVEGNEQSTSSFTTKVYATAKLPDSFDAKFGMFNINDLLSKFRLFKDEFSLSFDDNTKVVNVFNDYASVKVHTSDTSMITDPKIGASIGEDETDLVFELSNHTLQRMNDFTKVTGTNVIAFAKRDGDKYIRIEGYDQDKLQEAYLKGQNAEAVWFIRIEDEEYDGESFIYYSRFNFRMLDDDYTVRIRQFYGDRKDRSSDKLNQTRPPAIQFDGEYIRYAITYLQQSQNQQSLKEIKYEG